MNLPFSLVWCLFIPAVLTLPSASNANVVDLGYARFQGAPNPDYPDVIAFYGLRFAAAPTGDLRWRAPVPIESDDSYSKDKVIDATTAGPSCLQQYPAWQPPNPVTVVAETSEDCLLLNVFKPKEPSSSKLPVIVYIHGGGYDIGNSTSSSDGSYLVSKSKGDIIFLSIQYRLGALGFLGNKEVRSNGTANAGLLDQRAALHWVQRHIESFGGDCSKVTILGGSAGGGSVSAQLMLYGGENNPPFRAAVAEYPWFQPFHDEEVLETQYRDLLTASKCGDLSCLRQLPFSELNSSIVSVLNAGYLSSYGYGDYYLGPTVDGEIIQGLPMSEYSLGHFSRVPILVNHDALEGFLFTNLSITTQSEAFSDLQQVWPAATSSFFKNIMSLWPNSAFGAAYQSYLKNLTSDKYFESLIKEEGIPLQPLIKNTQFWRRQDIFGDGFINCPTFQIASSAVKYQVPVWKLVYNSGQLVHAAVYYGTIAAPPASLASPMQSADIRGYLISFATYLDPNGPGTSLPRWEGYGVGGRVLDVNLTQIAMAPDYDNSDRCRFLLENGPILRN